MAPSPYPFGLSNTAAAFASAYASAHGEPSGRHQRFALDLFATTSTHTHADSSEEDEAWARADFSGLCDPQAMRLFLAASDYYFGYSDSDDEPQPLATSYSQPMTSRNRPAASRS